MARIIDLKAREILDSRGNPTVEVDCWADGNILGRAAVPSGASTGIHEACEKRDEDEKRYLGKGVLQAVDNVNTIIRGAIKGMPVTGQRVLDQRLMELDGTPNKSRLGANALLAVSLAACRAAALSRGKALHSYLGDLYAAGTKPLLPVPMMNILNGGAHADNNVDIQEWMIMPAGRKTFSEGLRCGTEIFHQLKKILKGKKLSTSVGDEGGVAPNLESNKEAAELILQAIEKAGYKPGSDVWLAIDCASSGFYKDGVYHLSAEKPSVKKPAELIQWYEELCGKYPIASIEDGLAEDDWSHWRDLNQRLGKKTFLEKK